MNRVQRAFEKAEAAHQECDRLRKVSAALDRDPQAAPADREAARRAIAPAAAEAMRLSASWERTEASFRSSRFVRNFSIALGLAFACLVRLAMGKPAAALMVAVLVVSLWAAAVVWDHRPAV